MRTAVVAIGALVVLGTMLAAGASLTVASPVMQTFRYDVEPTPPPSDVDLYVDLQAYAGMSGRLTGTTLVGPFSVPAGGEYRIGYDGSHRSCPGDAADAPPRVGGPFPVTGAQHLLCVQHGDAEGRVITVRVGDDVQRRTVALDDGDAR